MTSLIDNTIDELIRRVKAQENLSGFAFTMGYPPRKLPNPIQKYLVCVDNGGVKISDIFIGGSVGRGRRGKLYETELTLRVYAPGYTAGSSLLRATALLADALERADTDGALRGISLSGIVYDTTARTVAREVKARLEYLLYEEAADE
jgi:hypothetical protein